MAQIRRKTELGVDFYQWVKQSIADALSRANRYADTLARERKATNDSFSRDRLRAAQRRVRSTRDKGWVTRSVREVQMCRAALERPATRHIRDAFPPAANTLRFINRESPAAGHNEIQVEMYDSRGVRVARLDVLGQAAFIEDVVLAVWERIQSADRDGALDVPGVELIDWSAPMPGMDRLRSHLRLVAPAVTRVGR